MKVFDVILIAVALSLDAATLTIANCTTYKNDLTRKKQWAMPVLFALFQAVMPLIGFYIGSVFASYISTFSGYLVAGIFFILAIKILIDFIKDIKGESVEQEGKPLTFGLLILQAVLTSIDALAIGVTFSLELAFSVYIAVLIICAITFLIVVLALFFGKALGKAFGKYSSLFGFAILLLLAIKNLLETLL